MAEGDRDEAARFRGCLLGGAVGDALGAPVEFDSWAGIVSTHGPEGVQGYAAAYGRRGAITDDTQMTLFTAEALIRAGTAGDGRGSEPVAALHSAYLRWLSTQDRSSRSDGSQDGWLLDQAFLHSRRAPGNTCLSALHSGRTGTRDTPLNDSMGCGGVMRVAPVGLFLDDPEEAFALGCEAAAITHGHPEGWLPAGAFAVIIAAARQGAPVRDAVEAGRDVLARHTPESVTVALLGRAVEVAAAGPPTPTVLESLGGAWVGPEALAISVCCALACEGDLRRGVLMAVNHSGDSDSTGAVCGNLLGAALGEGAVPSAWLDDLEGRNVIAAVADDLHAAKDGARPHDPAWAARYPPA